MTHFRTSKVAKLIEKLEFRLQVFKELQAGSKHETATYKGMIEGRISELENLIKELKEEFTL